jgi:hypothetical protein
MDIKCATCQEPWDHHHLLHDLPWDAWDGDDDSSSHLLIRRFGESDKTKIPKLLRQDLEFEGWKFGKSIVCVLECACCSSYDEKDEQELIDLRKDLRHEAESMLGDDLDGLISALQNIDIYAKMDEAQSA